MKLKDTLWLGVKGISERKVRTLLTVITVAIGVAAIVALISLVAGSSASITKSLESIGPSSIYMIPARGHIFTAADVAVLESLPNVSTVIPMIESSGTLSLDGQSVTATIIGVNNYSIVNAIGSLNIYEGVPFNNSALPQALVGHGIAFPTTTQSTSSVMLGEPIYLTQTGSSGTRTITLLPTGILNSYGSSIYVQPDTSIFLSLPEAESLLDTYSYNIIIVKARNASDASSLDSLLTTIYGNSANILSVEAIAATISSVIGSITLLLGSVAGISLLVAGISILSIMMVSVTERTREIGILKALGFKRREVLALFLSEAFIIGLIGGMAGVAIGAAGGYALPALLSSHSATTSSSSPSSSASAGGSGFAGRAGAGGRGGAGFAAGGAPGGGSSSGLSITPIVSPALALEAIVLAIVVAILSSLYPAWKAAGIDPIKALRSE